MSLLAACAIFILQAQVTPAQTNPYAASYAAASQKAQAIVSQMTLQEKLDFLGGTGSWDIKPIPRLSVPHVYGADAEMGLRYTTIQGAGYASQSTGQGVGYPSGQALAATWSADIAAQYGSALASDFRIGGYQFVNGPGMNMNRTPYGGRNAEYLSGEDPYIGAVLGTAAIRAIQTLGVMSVVKHPLMNEQETNRFHLNIGADERTMREIYMVPFEAAAKTAQAASFMCTFVLINGSQACQNNYLLTQVIKGEWGFRGFILSDYDAILDGVAAAIAGADLDMPNGYMMNSGNLMPAILSGTLPLSKIDDKVLRILTQEQLFGFAVNEPDPTNAVEVQTPASQKAATDMERQGMVLLTNRNHTLPLSASIKSIAVIGGFADGPPPSIFGSAAMSYINYVGELQGIQTAVPGATVAMVRGLSLQPAYTSSVAGFSATYYANNLFGGATVQRQEPVINHDWTAEALPTGGAALISAVYTGQVQAAITGDHVFKLRGDGALKLFVGGTQIAASAGIATAISPSIPPTIPIYAKVPLNAGQIYAIRIEYAQQPNFIGVMGGLLGIQFSWASLTAPQSLAQYDAVVVAAGSSAEYEGEGFDHPFNMPEYQAQMIASVAAVNPRTIALIHSGGATDIAGFSDQVGALIYMWYPGQNAGTALADVLFGKVNPSGKLPITLERSETDNPSYPTYPQVQNVLVPSTTINYSEGLFMGYRGYDSAHKVPLFPFGFGLSYTTFSYSGLSLQHNLARNTIDVTFQVTNTGSVAGAEVSQVYIGEENPSVPRPIKELKGFYKVFLQPGQSTWVTIPLNYRAFAYYDVAGKTWKMERGTYDFLVGRSSADIQLQKAVTNPNEVLLSVTTSEPAVFNGPTTSTRRPPPPANANPFL